MTGAVRSVLRGLRRPSTEPAPPAEVVRHARAEVRITIPSSAPTQTAAALEEGVEAMLARWRSELGLNRPASIRLITEDALAHSVTVAVDGRPAVVCRLPAVGQARNLLCQIERVLCRRLSLLLDETETAWHARRWQQGCHDGRPELYRRVPGYLLDNGISLIPPVEPGYPYQGSSDIELAEWLIDWACPDSMELELPDRLLRHTRPEHTGRLVSAREEMFARTGLQFPDLQLRPSESVSAGLRVRLNSLSLDCGDQPMPADWLAAVSMLQRLLIEHAPWFVRVSDVENTRQQLTDVLPDLVMLSVERHRPEMLSACLRCLLRNGDSVRNLPRILWLLLKPADSWEDGDLFQMVAPCESSLPDTDRDPELLASTIRRRITEEAWQAGSINPAPHTVCLPEELERAILDPAADGRAAGEWRIIRAVHAMETPVRVATRTIQALAPLRFALEALPSRPQVVAVQELSLNEMLTEISG